MKDLYKERNFQKMQRKTPYPLHLKFEIHTPKIDVPNGQNIRDKISQFLNVKKYILLKESEGDYKSELFIG